MKRTLDFRSKHKNMFRKMIISKRQHLKRAVINLLLLENHLRWMSSQTKHNFVLDLSFTTSSIHASEECTDFLGDYAGWKLEQAIPGVPKLNKFGRTTTAIRRNFPKKLPKKFPGEVGDHAYGKSTVRFRTSSMPRRDQI